MTMIRRARINDVENILALENKVWNTEQCVSRENITSRLRYYNDGALLAFNQGKLHASFFAIKRQHAIGSPINWLNESGNGTGNTHDVYGDSMFSLSITVSPDAPPGTYRKMMDAWRELAQKEKCKSIYAGSRLPGLQQYNGKTEDYLEQVRKGEIFDAVLSKAKRCGFQIGSLLPNYFYDPASLHYGVEIYQLT